MADLSNASCDVCSHTIHLSNENPEGEANSMTEITTVRFDGVYVTLQAADGSVVGSAMAVSGVKGYQNPSFSSLSNKGPIPAGTYTLDPSTIDFRNFYENFAAGWGNAYVNLIPEPGTITFGRTGFNLHGSLPGNGFGSLGCIDLDDQDTYILGLLSQYGSTRVEDKGTLPFTSPQNPAIPSPCHVSPALFLPICPITSPSGETVGRMCFLMMRTGNFIWRCWGNMLQNSGWRLRLIV